MGNFSVSFSLLAARWTRGLQVKAVPTKAKRIKQGLNRGYSVNSTIETCVTNYFKLGISLPVQSEESIQVNMLQSPA